MSLRELLASPGSSRCDFAAAGALFLPAARPAKGQEATSPKWPKWTEKPLEGSTIAPSCSKQVLGSSARPKVWCRERLDSNATR